MSKYYVRWKSSVSGPFSAEAVRALLSAGKISKHHQVSSDRALWTPLRESETFKSSCILEPISLSSSAPEKADHGSTRLALTSREYAIPVTDAAKRPPPISVVESPGSGAEYGDWYYSLDGQVLGPVAGSEMRQLMLNGTVKSDTPVCRVGEDTWCVAGDVFSAGNATAAPRTRIQESTPIAQPPPLAVVQPAPTSALAIWSLVLALIGIALPAIICGHIGISRIRESKGALAGEGMCIAGLIIGYLSLVIYLLYWASL